MTYPPKEIAELYCESANRKIKKSTLKFCLLAFLGGAFIAFGGLLTVIVVGGSPTLISENPGLAKFLAGALFPVGLIMVSVAGADLFTSDCAGMTLLYLQRNIKFKTLLKIWALSYFMNFIGAQFIAYYMSSQLGLFDANACQNYLHNLANIKINQDGFTVFMKGIGANWLVCLGTWMGFASKDLWGKAIGIWIPVMLFVTLGFEHSIANMFFIPAAIYSGADITWIEFVTNNLITATLGNIVGGALLVGCVYWFIYLREEK